MLTVLVSTISNSQVFCWKNASSFCKCCKSYAHFFSKNISVYAAVFNDQSFTYTLTNEIVSFEQLGSDIYLTSPWKHMLRISLEVALHLPPPPPPTPLRHFWWVPTSFFFLWRKKKTIIWICHLKWIWEILKGYYEPFSYSNEHCLLCKDN